MSYFNHAFEKTFLATKATQEESGTIGSANGKAAVTGGILTSKDVPVWMLKSTSAKEGYQLGTGVTGVFDKNNKSIASADALENGEPFYIASAAIMQQDKIGPFHGGYQEASKSKKINPRFVHKAWKVIANEAVAPKLAIGAEYDSDGNLVQCGHDFYCGEHYNLRVDIKGESALRFTNHNIYRTFQAYGGCCSGDSVSTIDKGVIYKQWASMICEDNYTKDFVRAYIIADGETYSYSKEDAALVGANEAKLYSVDDEINTLPDTNTSIYIVMLGAYEDTKFGNCSFQPSDYYGLAPIRLYAEEVDLEGDPCGFNGICTTNISLGVQANGLGEQKLRAILRSESYLQNHMANDARIREITGGDALLSCVDRSALYDSVFIQHSIPRYNNPTSTFDADQYLIEIVFNHKEATETDNRGIKVLETLLLPAFYNYSSIDCESTTEGTTTTYSFEDLSTVTSDTFEFPVKE